MKQKLVELGDAIGKAECSIFSRYVGERYTPMKQYWDMYSQLTKLQCDCEVAANLRADDSNNVEDRATKLRFVVMQLQTGYDKLVDDLNRFVEFLDERETYYKTHDHDA